MTILIKIVNNNFDSDMMFYGIFIGVVGGIGYSLARQIFSKSYVDQSVQTDAKENFSERPSGIENLSEKVSLIETQTPVSSTSTLVPTTSEVGAQTDVSSSSTFKDTSSLIPTTSEVGTQTDVTPVKIEITPPQDIVERVVDPSNAEYIATKVDQLNALDPFGARPWTADRVNTMIDSLGTMSDLFL